MRLGAAISRLFAGCPGVLLALAACSLTNAAPPPLAVPMLSGFSLSQVRLLDGPFKRAEELNRAYLLSIDPERLLYHFRVNAGVPTAARPYGGWEASDWDFHGHILGHYLSACSQMAAHGGEPEFKRRVDYIVAALAECQKALAKTASHPGFLDPQPEAVFVRLEQGAGDVGVPYYTMHKTMAGLLDAYTLAGNQQALSVVEGMADWLKARLDRLSDAQLQYALRIEHGGINEALANLYAITGDRDHLCLAERLNHAQFFGPFSLGDDPLGPGKGPGRLIHANTQVPKAISAAREYELTDYPPFHDVAVNFWHDVAETRSFIIGGNSDAEHFFERGTESRHLTARTAEFCNTYNMLKLTRHLFTWAPKAELMDFYERALFNHVLAAQNPETGMNTYFMSLEPGGRKRFGTPDNTFWCCTGSSMEMNSKVADSIYFHDADSLYVNLFIASELHWAERGLTVTQLTQFPDDDATELSFATSHPQRLIVRLRHPGWSDHPTVEVNGEPLSASEDAAGYLVVDRVWHDGDRLKLLTPMRLRAVPLADAPDEVAFVYGPIVLAGDLGNKGLAFLPDEFVDNGKDPRGPRVPEVPVQVPGLVANAADVVSHVQRIPGRLEFRTDGIGRPEDIALLPLYRIVEDRYTVYWKLYDEARWNLSQFEHRADESQRHEEQARILDAVWFGLPRSEAAHAVVGVNAPQISSRMRLFRDAAGGSIAFKLKVTRAEAFELRVGYYDGGSAAFDVQIEGQTVAVVRPEGAEKTGATAKKGGTPVATIHSFVVPTAVVGDRPVVEVRIVGRGDAGPARIVFCELLVASERLPCRVSSAAGAHPW